MVSVPVENEILLNNCLLTREKWPFNEGIFGSIPITTYTSGSIDFAIAFRPLVFYCCLTLHDLGL